MFVALSRNAIRLFTTPEIIPYPFPDQQVLESHTSLGRGDASLAEHWRETLHTRIVQHVNALCCLPLSLFLACGVSDVVTVMLLVVCVSVSFCCHNDDRTCA